MAKFCGNCGAEMEDQALFCPECGERAAAVPAEPAAPAEPIAPAEPAAPQTAETQASKKIDVNGYVDKLQSFTVKAADYSKDYVVKAKKDPKKWILPGGILAGIIVLIVVLCIAFSGPAYKRALDNYCGLMTGNIKYLDKMAPKGYWDYLEEETDMSFKELKENLADVLEDVKDDLEDEYGKNAKITYKIRDEKELSKKKLKKIQEALEDQYDMEVKVKKGYELEVKVTIKGSEDSESEKEDVTVIQIGGNWYVVNYREYSDEVYVSFIDLK